MGKFELNSLFGKLGYSRVAVYMKESTKLTHKPMQYDTTKIPDQTLNLACY
jgi:hypothetical protein